MSIYLLFSKGGWLMWPVLGCSVVGVAVFMERLFYFWRIRRPCNAFPGGCQADGQGGLAAPFEEAARGSRYPALAARMIAQAWQARHGGYEAMREVLEVVMEEMVSRAASGLGLLATLVSLSPLLGLLGTVVGLIKAFMVIEQAGGRVNACALAGGIWEAMLTTAAGLAVAIVLTVLHKFLACQVEGLEEGLLRDARLFMASFKGIDEKMEEDKA